MGLLQINKNPSQKELQWVGLLLLLFAGIVAAIVYKGSGSAFAAKTIGVVGVVLCVVYYAVAPLRKPMYLGWLYAAFPIGWVISHLILGLTFYLLMTPIGLLLRLFGKDPMERRWKPEANTYWVEHVPAGSPSRYFRQF